MNHFFAIDRIENGYAVIECPDKSFITVTVSSLPEGVKEGSILIKNSKGNYEIYTEEEIKRKKINYELQNSIFGGK